MWECRIYIYQSHTSQLRNERERKKKDITPHFSLEGYSFSTLKALSLEGFMSCSGVTLGTTLSTLEPLGDDLKPQCTRNQQRGLLQTVHHQPHKEPVLLADGCISSFQSVS